METNIKSHLHHNNNNDNMTSPHLPAHSLYYTIVCRFNVNIMPFRIHTSTGDKIFGGRKNLAEYIIYS